ncbi:MAG TPA: chemotaxis protein CheW [Bacteroidales bacterium]|nr:chemotaxis protein CheW [Bacteroidales bacterium]HPT12595.1 chemotaxis protein CheW [Bacteroidales bacterium]
MEKETYLTFILGQECFAVNVSNVLEVLEKQQITQVPNAPGHLLGIINFRGVILPVVNMHKRFGISAVTPEEMSSFLIVFEIGDDESKITIAATADAVKDVIDINPEEIKPLPEMGISYDAQFIQGAIRRDSGFILILKTEKIFSIADTVIVNN